MELIVSKDDNSLLGYPASIDEVRDVVDRMAFEPFLRNGFILYKDSLGKFGVCNPERHIVRRLVE